MCALGVELVVGLEASAFLLRLEMTAIGRVCSVYLAHSR